MKPPVCKDAVLFLWRVLGDCMLSRSRSRNWSRSRFTKRDFVDRVAEAVVTGMTRLAIMKPTKEGEMINLWQAKRVSLIESVEATIFRNDEVRKGCFDGCIGGDLRIQETVEP